MAPKGAHVGVIASVLGYCILPIVILSVINILIDLKGIIGTVASIAAVLWSVPPKSTSIAQTQPEPIQSQSQFWPWVNSILAQTKPFLGVQYQHLGYSQMV